MHVRLPCYFVRRIDCKQLEIQPNAVCSDVAKAKVQKEQYLEKDLLMTQQYRIMLIEHFKYRLYLKVTIIHFI